MGKSVRARWWHWIRLCRVEATAVRGNSLLSRHLHVRLSGHVPAHKHYPDPRHQISPVVRYEKILWTGVTTKHGMAYDGWPGATILTLHDYAHRDIQWDSWQGEGYYWQGLVHEQPAFHWRHHHTNHCANLQKIKCKRMTGKTHSRGNTQFPCAFISLVLRYVKWIKIISKHLSGGLRLGSNFNNAKLQWLWCTLDSLCWMRTLFFLWNTKIKSKFFYLIWFC